METFVSKNGMQKSATGDVYDRLRREVACLAKLRHPSLCKLIEPLEESKGTMRFVTEPLTSCLQHMIDLNSSGAGSSALDGGELDEIVIQKGILQIAEGLDFLHSAGGLVHLDIQPSSILINVKGDWKLSGLGFVQNVKETTSQEYFVPKFDPRLPPFVQVNLDYSAPELILDHKLDMSNDIFSLGCLLIALFTYRPPMRTDNNSNVYKQEFAGISKIFRDERIPEYLHDMIPQMVARYPEQRLTLEQFKSSSLFDNVLIRTINFLDDFPVKLPAEQQAFMTGFTKLIDQFPKSVLQKKILPTLLEELGKEETLVGPILTNIFEVGKDMSQLGFSKKILPGIKKVSKVLSAQVAILTYIDTIKSRVNGNEFRDDILPIVLDTMDTAPPEIQEAALQKLSIVIDKLDFITLKNDVFPMVGSVFAKTTSLSVKLEALNGFEKLVSHGLDKYAVTEKLLPLLNGMKTREPKVMMGALSVYSKVIEIVDIEVLARVIVPQLLSMSMESMLNLSQFRAFMDEIKTLLDRIEKEHGKRLSGVQVEAKARTSNVDTAESSETGDFEALVYGRNKSAPTGSGITASSTASSTGRSTPKTAISPSTTSVPSSSFGSLKLEPSSKRPSIPPLQPLSSFSKGHDSPASPQINWQQPLASKPSISFGSTGTLTPMNANRTGSSSATSSNWDSMRSNLSNPLAPSSNSNPGTGMGLGLSTTPNYSSQPLYNTSSNGTQNQGTSIDWSAATKPKPAPTSAFNNYNNHTNNFGDFQTSSPAVSSPPALSNPAKGMGMSFSTPLSPSAPGWSGSAAALQPQQKYHIGGASRSGSQTSTATTSTGAGKPGAAAPTNNFSLI